MPKIIRDVEDSVYHAVMAVMTTDGIDRLSMKRIAESSGIAVGTLYNYFPDREKLISKAIQYSWNQSFKKLDTLLKQPDSALNTWITFHDMLYSEMVKRKAIGHELIRQQVLSEDVKQEIYGHLHACYALLFERLQTEKQTVYPESTQQRMIETLINTVLRLAIRFPNEELTNRRYINQCVRVMLTISHDDAHNQNNINEE